MTALIIHPDIFQTSPFFSPFAFPFAPKRLWIFSGQKTFQDTGSGSGYSGYRRLSYGVDYIDADEIAEEEEAKPPWGMRWGVDGLGFLVEGKKMGSPKKLGATPNKIAQGFLMKKWSILGGY